MFGKGGTSSIERIKESQEQTARGRGGEIDR